MKRTIKAWCLLRDQYAHVKPVEETFGAAAEFIYDSAWDAAALTAAAPDIVVCVNDHSYEAAQCLLAARAGGHPLAGGAGRHPGVALPVRKPALRGGRGGAAAPAGDGRQDRLHRGAERPADRGVGQRGEGGGDGHAAAGQDAGKRRPAAQTAGREAAGDDGEEAVVRRCAA